MVVKFYISLFAVLFLFIQGCTTAREAKMLKKMDGIVPATSKWLGGKDGGVWVNIAILPKNTFEIIIYNDYTGKKIAELVYEYTCANIDEKLIFKALSGFGNGLQWVPDNPITKCVNLKEKASN